MRERQRYTRELTVGVLARRTGARPQDRRRTHAAPGTFSSPVLLSGVSRQYLARKSWTRQTHRDWWHSLRFMIPSAMCGKRDICLMERQNGSTGEVSLACPYCDMEELGGGDAERSIIEEAFLALDSIESTRRLCVAATRPRCDGAKWRLNRDYEYVQDSHHPLRRVSQWQSGNQSRFAISSTSRRYDVGGCSSSPGAPSVLSTQPLPTKEYLRLLRQLTIVPVRLNFAVRKNQLVACIRITPLVQR